MNTDLIIFIVVMVIAGAFAGAGIWAYHKDKKRKKGKAQGIVMILMWAFICVLGVYVGLAHGLPGSSTNLSDLYWVDVVDRGGGGFVYHLSVTDNLGEEYDSGIGGASRDLNAQVFRINSEYATITGRIVLNYNYRDMESTDTFVRIYADGEAEPRYISPLIASQTMPVDFVVCIADVDYIRITIHGQNMIRLVNGELLRNHVRDATGCYC